jgi:GTP-binding protein
MSEKAPPVYPPAKESDAPFAAMPVTFMGSFPDATHRLEPRLPEIAMLGRSNVGKSSLLNALFGRRLANVSNTPGRTGQVNVFRLPSLYLIDLPGYGFARVSQSERSRYQKLVRGLVEKRRSLTGIVWLLDIRHDPSSEDLAYGEILAQQGTPVLVVLTKGDKLPFAQRRKRLQEFPALLALPEEQVQLTSSSTGEGIAELGQSLLGAASGKEESK